ncbi:hypothetical protein LTR37_012761 [Vermiconidia calcicola]|uniref:Uncharacterized protein n=1 Tax=Vermiconidia calcicola TaxID=1690605 RepID=A0ACC3MYH5_9PEZI|nr:hypothetical protein LTR37_012761 [Vermiconidia calcicola]
MAFLDHAQIASANVYAIPMNKYGYDGQAGAAAITMRKGASADGPDQAEIDALRDLEHYLTVKAGLASYAVPRFVRVLVDEKEAPQREQIGISDSVGSEYVSSMLKKLKTSLREEAFSLPSHCRDRIYWIEKEGQGFVHLTSGAREHLLQGTAKL